MDNKTLIQEIEESQKDPEFRKIVRDFIKSTTS